MTTEQSEPIEDLPPVETSSVDDETAEAQTQAAAIGGTGTAEADPAQQAVREAGGGEAEGFEQAEADLVRNATHGDEHAAGRVLQDAPAPEAEPELAEYADADGQDEES